ncbi:hypothetical protein V5799_015569 [Amblyomma americanum]|uniref:Uncharacterized protein n=1 Tax=Amblyomma americanum TaxID=6943 RepID=A0AAQ4F7H1_AMBAM
MKTLEQQLLAEARHEVRAEEDESRSRTFGTCENLLRVEVNRNEASEDHDRHRGDQHRFNTLRGQVSSWHEEPAWTPLSGTSVLPRRRRCARSCCTASWCSS